MRISPLAPSSLMVVLWGMLPPLIHVSLDAAARSFCVIQVPGHRQRPQKKIAPSKGRGRGATPAARPLQTRQRSGLGLSKSGLERCSSYSKRRRNEYDMADILMSDAKYVERPKVCFLLLTPLVFTALPIHTGCLAAPKLSLRSALT